MSISAVKIRLVGIVQGVGFRPFVYRLATRLGLRGYVVNRGGAEVEIFVEGDDDKINRFMMLLEREKPPPALFEEIFIERSSPLNLRDFRILKSVYDRSRRSMIPPDVAICEECTREIKDPSSRFYRYYWNSCAWCGPRFSMIYRTPYDRENTSMRKYLLCEKCRHDYEDPDNIRRFHAEGISCPICGVRTYLYDNRGRKIDLREDLVDFISKEILKGSIVAIKGVGGYHIAALASRDDVVLELRRRKKRPQKPFALMAKDLDVVKRLVYLNEKAEKILRSPQRPILILPKRDDAPVSEYVAPELSSLGIMLPYTGFQILLLDKIPDGFLIMTSGNIHGRPMCIDLDCVLRELSEIVDYIVEHDREIVHRVDDSVIRFTDEESVFLRRSRGYAPMWIKTSFDIGEYVAVGAELQVAGAVSFENKIIPTQFIGDLDDPGNLQDLERELRWFIEIYDIKPRAIVMDMHPLYHNRDVAKKLAEIYETRLVEAQHHHAHITSLMIEEGYEPDEMSIGVAIDGTGYGVNGEIWGGEILLSRYDRFVRLGSLRPFNLPGGDSSAEYPVKSLIGMMVLRRYSLEEVIKILKTRDLVKTLPYKEEEAEITYWLSYKKKGVETSSLGRTLDGISALLGVCSIRTYEGEPPIKLESLADRGVYLRNIDLEIPLLYQDDRLMIDASYVIEYLINNFSKNIDTKDLAATILYSIGRAFGEAVIKTVRGYRISRNEILVSGGAAVNTHIIRGIREIARENDLLVKINRKIPPGDGGISVGQIAIASSIIGSYD
jgi:hydrogenase maturation protein HypF